jgi:hypothetical protein
LIVVLSKEAIARFVKKGDFALSQQCFGALGVVNV